MRTIECNCEKNFEADIPDYYDLDEQPQLLQEITSGNFLTFTCPHCKATIKPELPFEIVQKSKKFRLRFVPELDRAKVKEHEIDIKPANREEENDQFLIRLVIGYQELVEKLKIFELNYDDRAVEIVKYHILTKAMQLEEEPADETNETKPAEETGREPSAKPESNEAAIYVYFKEQTKKQLIFHIHNLKPGNVAIFKLNAEVYDKSLKNLGQALKKEPFNRILTPPYVSINNLYMEK